MKTVISRRDFLRAGATAGALLAAPRRTFGQNASAKSRKPNILLISTDQWSWHAFGFHGNPHVKTPNADRLAAMGVDFSRSYSTDPVCGPARTCWMTGRMPNEHGVIGNSSPVVKTMPDMGQWFGANGYETVHVGKWDTPGRDPTKSFAGYCGTYAAGQYVDLPVADSAQSYLLNRRSDKPFLMHVSLMNPHDICQIGCLFPSKNGIPLPEDIPLPPLPENFKARPVEPKTLISKVRSSYKRTASREWTEADWRFYNWTYYRYCEMVDAAIGRVLDALEASGEAANTMVVFTSDHGEGLGSHGLYWKAFMYDESVRVPFVLAFPGRLPSGVKNENIFVSGIDLFPTFCDVAGIPRPENLCGENIFAQVESGRRARETLVTSASFGGRMVVDDRYKSIRYKNDPVLQLFDLKADPGETVNIAAQNAPLLATHEQILKDFEARLVPSSPENRWAAG